MKHFWQCCSSESMQCLGLLLHIQKINGKRKPYNDFGVKRSKVNLPPTYWLHFISERKSLRLLITDTSYFVTIWRMMIWRHSEHQRTKSLFSRSVTHAFRLSFVSIPFLVNCASISAPYMRFVIKARWTLCFGIFPFHQIDYFTYISPEMWDIVQVMQFRQIDLPKFRFIELGSNSAIRLTNNMHNIYKYQKEYVPAFYKII